MPRWMIPRVAHCNSGALPVGGAWQAPPGWQTTRRHVFATYGRACWRCGAYATTVDHVTPVILGGSHDLANLRPCCAPCNSRAGARIGNRLRSRRRARTRWATSRRW